MRPSWRHDLWPTIVGKSHLLIYNLYYFGELILDGAPRPDHSTSSGETYLSFIINGGFFIVMISHTCI
ncbi:hypothetical protein DFH27DRAFT_572513 [Peziza echinospora]|nr:hypothetical protein DFH27DRAFT_572513 [Peziza echinospora]